MGSDYVFDNPVPAVDDDRRPDVVFICSGAPPQGVDWQDAQRVDAQGRRADGEADFDFVRFEFHDAVRITGAMDFHVYDDRIHCHLHDERHRYLVEVALLGMVFALWLERRGVPTLHAAVSVVHGGAVGFLGNKGGGKTTLTTALLAAGHSFLADDLLALSERDATVVVERGVPALRLWPEQIAHFVGGQQTFPLVHPDFPKCRVDVPAAFGRFADGPAPLRRLYVPQRLPEGSQDVVIEPLAAQDALIELVRHSFLPREVQRYGWQQRRLQSFAAVLASVAVMRLRYPSGYARLAEVVAAVETDLTGLS